jgi:DNA-binding transcriptional MerR regulator
MRRMLKARVCYRSTRIVAFVSAPAKDLSIGQVSARTGLSVHALRFYEREGVLIGPVARSANGRRVYSEDDVEWLADCVRLRSSGMPLAEIRRYAALVRRGAGTEEDRLAILCQHQDRLIAQLRGLHDCLDLVTYKIGLYKDLLAETAEDHPPSAAGG